MPTNIYCMINLFSPVCYLYNLFWLYNKLLFLFFVLLFLFIFLQYFSLIWSQKFINTTENLSTAVNQKLLEFPASFQNCLNLRVLRELKGTLNTRILLANQHSFYFVTRRFIWLGIYVKYKSFFKCNLGMWNRSSPNL